MNEEEEELLRSIRRNIIAPFSLMHTSTKMKKYFFFARYFSFILPDLCVRNHNLRRKCLYVVLEICFFPSLSIFFLYLITQTDYVYRTIIL